MGKIAPYLLYEDGAAAIDFLTAAFGFEEVMRMEDGGVVNDQEYGDRRYDAKDPEGQFWSFSTALKAS